MAALAAERDAHAAAVAVLHASSVQVLALHEATLAQERGAHTTAMVMAGEAKALVESRLAAVTAERDALAAIVDAAAAETRRVAEEEAARLAAVAAAAEVCGFYSLWPLILTRFVV